jgi:transposase
LDLAKHQQALRAHLDSVVEASVAGLVAELARDELNEVVELTYKINTLAKRIERRTTQVAPTLLAMPGVGPLTAAKMVGEAAASPGSSQRPRSPATPESPRSRSGRATPPAGFG